MPFVPIIVKDIEEPLRMLEKQMYMTEDIFPYLSSRKHNNCARRNVVVHPFLNGTLRCPLSNHTNNQDSVTRDKENYLVKLDLQHYTPEEITVKVLDENSIMVEAKHESIDENGSIFRHLTQQFVVPEGHDLKVVETKLSGDGLLFITAPKKTQLALEERVIPVTHIETKKS